MAADAEAEKIFAAQAMEVALRKSDVALREGRLGAMNGYWSWDWRDFAAEELHNELQRASLHLCELLSDDDWSLFSYEVLLLAQEQMQLQGDRSLEHLQSVLPRFRASLGIHMPLHHQLAELTVPNSDASLGVGIALSASASLLDVRFRAMLLLRAWSMVEVSGVPNPSPVFKAWLQRQIAVLRGSVAVQARELHSEGHAPAAQNSALTCLRALRQLEVLTTAGVWGHGLVGQTGGRRILMNLCRELEALRPQEDMWKFHKIFAVGIFSKLWSAATDKEAEDRLSLEAPVVAAALLSCLHPFLGKTPLQLESHALLLGQQLWIALSTRSASAPPGYMGLPFQYPAQALEKAAMILEDFTKWLEHSPVDAASCFARPHSPGSVVTEEAAELTALRLQTTDLRDGVVQALLDYRRCLEPDAFGSALTIWAHSHVETRCSDVLTEAAVTSRSASHHRADSPQAGQRSALRNSIAAHWSKSNESLTASEEAESAVLEGVVADEAEFVRRMGMWFIWRTSLGTAESALSTCTAAPVVPRNNPVAWKQLGDKIKGHLESLASCVQDLLSDLECEKTFYHRGWEGQGLGKEHLGITAAAMAAVVRPKLQALLVHNVWPTAPATQDGASAAGPEGGQVLEIPAGGGKLLQALEALDRAANRWPEPLSRPLEEGVTSPSLVDVLVPHVTAALEESFTVLDRDVTSKVFVCSDDICFQPLRPPTLLYCERVVTLWRFAHDALDAPLSLGVPVDILVKPFISNFLGQVLDRIGKRLVRADEKPEVFRIATRAAQVEKELRESDFIPEDEEEDAGVSGGETSTTVRKAKKKKAWKSPFFTGGSTAELEKAATKNTITEVRFLEPEQPIKTDFKQVTVRLSSLGFCLQELDGIYSKLFTQVNSGDDSDRPTRRHNDAKIIICEELPDLHYVLLERGLRLARFLAARLVYWELRSDFFERLYFTPSTPGGGVASGQTPTATSSEPLGFGMSSMSFTLEVILTQRHDAILSLVSQIPAPLLMAFVVELGMQLTRAWMYVVMDYLRRLKVDQVAPHLDTDSHALKRLLTNVMKQVRLKLAQRESTKQSQRSLSTFALESVDNGQKQLEEVQSLAQDLALKVQSWSPEELQRYAIKCCEASLPQAEALAPVTPRAGATPKRDQSPIYLERGRSPGGASQFFGGRARSVSPVGGEAPAIPAATWGGSSRPLASSFTVAAATKREQSDPPVKTASTAAMASAPVADGSTSARGGATPRWNVMKAVATATKRFKSGGSSSKPKP